MSPERRSDEIPAAGSMEREERAWLEKEIEERRRVEEALRRSEEYFRALTENAADLIAVLEADGMFRYASPSVLRILGYTAAELRGTNGFELVHPDDLPAVLDAIRAALERRDTGLPMTFKVRHKDGSWRFIEATDRNLLDNDAVRGLVINGRDVTERVRASEALRENDRRKDEFLAMLAHELRNPLAPIRTAVEVLRRRGREKPELVDWAGDLIARQAQHLTRLVDDLLDVSRITRGKIALAIEAVDLGAVIGRAVEMVRPLIDARRQELTVLLPSEPVGLQGDPVRLPQVVANLLNNASKYTPEGGHIGVATERRSRAVDIRVRDDGMGIPAEMLPCIFDLFVQADRSLDRSHGGLGVGLTLVRRLAEMHGGTVTASSAGPGRGSEFVVSLPTADTISAAPRGTAGESAEDSGARRILVVDDNRDAAESLAVMLRLMGHGVETAHSGPAALALAPALAPDVVLLDIGLPGMDGYEVARRLRAAGEPQPVLIAVTGYGQEEDRRRSREAGCDHHLVKPVDHEDLERVITRVRRADVGR
jgi:two-component system CheB/CheR fusion protein